MYVESVAASTGSTRNAGTVKPANIVNITAAKPAKAATAENTVQAESTEGDSRQKETGAVYDKKSDTRTADEKNAAENEKIKKAIENMKAQLPNSEIKFGIHEKTDRVTIKLVDKDTEEVIKEFPPEKTLDMIAKCMELAGVLVDEKL